MMAAYHDDEWGVPVWEDDRLFELLTLEGAQAGLSWDTVLKKREGYRRVFYGFSIERVAEMTSDDVGTIMQDPGVIRNRAKIESTVGNARAVLVMRDDGISFSDFLWSFAGGAPMIRRPATMAEVPAKTGESDAMSKALIKRGFKFVGSTICYAFMQASGMVDDHVEGCFCAQAR
jgi:DNA-3-methyladenine glycosylase I